ESASKAIHAPSSRSFFIPGSLKQEKRLLRRKPPSKTNTTGKGELRPSLSARASIRALLGRGLLRTIKGVRKGFAHGFFISGSVSAGEELDASVTVTRAFAVPIKPVRSSRTPRRRK